MFGKKIHFTGNKPVPAPLALRCFYLACYLIPGIAAYCLVNIEPVMKGWGSTDRSLC